MATQKKQRTSKKYCKVCKKKVRGVGHEEGTHHRGIAIRRNR